MTRLRSLAPGIASPWSERLRRLQRRGGGAPLTRRRGQGRDWGSAIAHWIEARAAAAQQPMAAAGLACRRRPVGLKQLGWSEVALALGILGAVLLANAASAEAVLAARTIRAMDVIGPEDVRLSDMEMPGAATSPEEVVGQEARITLYAGRPIRPADVGPPAVVERNAVIPLIFRSGVLTIATEGRALDRGGPGDVVQVMNLASRTIVLATLSADGAAYVSN